MAAHTQSPLPLRRHRYQRLAALALMVVVAATAYHFLWRQHVKRFQVISPGVLYRVAQPSELGIRYLVQRHHVKTVLNLRLEDDHLRRGVLAVGVATGDVESRFVADLGVRSLQWPMGREACWPWVSPWQFEEFYRLFDNPENFPIAIHCVSGRHRTGTIAALYRLEYDRWPIDRVLDEMYSFSFGPPIPLQEMNLRTYVPRPSPTPDEWQALCATWKDFLANDLPADYATLVRELRTTSDAATRDRKMIEQLACDGVFALPLAVRLIDKPDVAILPAALAAANRCLVGARDAQKPDESQSRHENILSAASLIADFGNTEDQGQLFKTLKDGREQPHVTPVFRALVAGVANRYTGNRVPFLAVLLDDTRTMPDTGEPTARYCDMAIAHLSAIVDERLINVGATPTPADWEQARQHAKTWLSTHPALLQATRAEWPVSPAFMR